MILGIDLGTTHSLGAVWQDGKVRLVPNALGDCYTPSCVGVDEDGSILVGKSALDRLQTHPDKTAALFKRAMGSDRKFHLDGRDFRAEELAALLLRALKDDAEAMLGHPVTEAVITVPAYFSDSQRKATRSAGQLAGLKVDRLLSEPTAAALAYGLHEAADQSKFLMFDLGGGTFDVSIIEKFDGVMEVHATAGDNFLGGEDFTAQMVAAFWSESEVPEAARADAGFAQQLTAQAEAAKRALSSASSAVIQAVWAGTEYRVELNEARLLAMSQELLARLRAPVERALRDARIRAAEVDHVVLVGGATRMPMVRQLVTRMFGRFPHVEVNPDEVVAAGAAVMAGLKMKDAALREVVMTDVCPYSLGVEVGRTLADGREVGGIFSPIIERNTVIPVSRVESYWPGRDNQRQVTLEIYQGEARLVQDNIKLGELSVKLPPGTREDGAIDVRFTYDVNGLLEVEVLVCKSGQRERMVIQNSGQTLSDEEVQQRLQALAQLKIHPRDQAENRALMAQAERVYQQLLGRRRDAFGEEIANFEIALASQNEKTCHAARVRLRQVLEVIARDGHFMPEFEE